ncbi:flagellar motor switch protein FliM [Tumebacillus permanentifrigoris]|uniref:Flagellar motor switch protein FliM n=1 Tax=Tumebacillus permanentifrigoris TaxID=378543 RepID=A0A316D7J4_9BACL|nr:flagellar motor switch protein FliM [Tumebacillus permanentifrigoris]PWK12703.1 flagellar motor switch protein FliM [Tumebacillus permanentifrigoris]
MAEVLSQNEIDALLSALTSGEITAEEIRKDDSDRKIKVYDFKRAMRFSKDHIRSITRIFENFARLLTTYFSAQLRTFVQISVVSVDQLPYEEFIRSISKMTILNVFNCRPLEGKFVMEVHPNIAYAMLDRLLGGAGLGTDVLRDLTEIEMTIMERVFGRALDNFEEAWKGVAELVTELDHLEVNPQFLQLVSPNETVAVVSLSTKIGEITGMINICMPHVVLEPIVPQLSTHYWMGTSKSTKDYSEEWESIRQNLGKTQVPLVAELGSSSISIGEFLALNVGDVITLDQDVKAKLQLKVGERLKFTGQPGTVRGKVAVQISQVIDEGVGDDE